MATTYYIDDSGYSGDLAIARDGLEFNGQPDFVLAAVGIRDITTLTREIAAIVSRHRIGGSELKWTRVQTRGRFVRDVIEYLIDNDHPLLVECVDKRFFIAIQIVIAQVLPPLATHNEGAEGRFIRNAMAEFLSEQAPNSVFEAFLHACRKPSMANVIASLEAMLNWLPGRPIPGPQIFECVEDVRAELTALAEVHSDAYLQFLPLPDNNRKGQPVWLLPNYSSLANLYARVNQMHGRDLCAVRLVHDEQSYLQDIIESAKRAVEALDPDQSRISEHADYGFSQTAPMSFERSDGSIGLQLADIVAGLVRHTVAAHRAGKFIHPDLWQAFCRFWEATPTRLGPGLNLVAPTQLVTSMACRRQIENGEYG